MKQILPIRFGILYTIFKCGPIHDFDIINAIKPYYGAERQFNKKNIINHIESLRASGLIREQSVSLTAHKELTSIYEITETGSGRMKYLPWTE